MADRSVSPTGNRLAAAALGCVALASLALSLAALPRESGGRVWSGYRSLLVDAAVDEADVLAALARDGIRDVLSRSTQPVAISDWVRLETTSLGALDGRLIPGDPRRDPYIRSLESWFAASAGGRPFRAYYFPESGPFFPEAALLRSLAAFPGKWILPDEAGSRGPSAAWAGAAAMALLLAVAAGYVRKGRGPGFPDAPRIVLRALLAGPWIAVAAGGPAAAAVGVLWGTAFAELADRLELPLDEFRRKASAKAAFECFALQGPLKPGLFIVAFGSLGLSTGNVMPAAFALAAALCAAAAFALLSAGLAIGRRRFVPRPLVSLRRDAAFAEAGRAALSALAILLWAGARLLSAEAGEATRETALMPVPIAAKGSPRPGPSEAASSLASATRPGLADWLAHLAIQEAIPLERIGAAGSHPFDPARVLGRAGVESSLSFDEDWARAAYRGIARSSVEGMLAFQGAAVSAAPRKAAPSRVRPLAPIDALLYIFLLILPLRRIVAGLPAARSPRAGGLRQEA